MHSHSQFHSHTIHMVACERGHAYTQAYMHTRAYTDAGNTLTLPFPFCCQIATPVITPQKGETEFSHSQQSLRQQRLQPLHDNSQDLCPNVGTGTSAQSQNSDIAIPARTSLKSVRQTVTVTFSAAAK